MSAIRIARVPQTDIEFRPAWVGQSMVGIEVLTGSCQQEIGGMYFVTPQGIVDGLKAQGKIHAADWWEMYFLYTSCRDRKPLKSGLMGFAAIDCSYLP